MKKSIVQFDPVATLAPAEAERHYVDVHTAMARRLMRYHVPSVARYAPQRVLASYDIAGNFARRPDAWRFIFLLHEDDHYLPLEWRTVVSQDHTRCLEGLRSYVVDDPEILVDHRSGQTSSAKFVFKLGAPGAEHRPLREQVKEVAEHFQTAFGARLMIANWISRQRGTEPLERPGQMTTRELFPSDVECILEFYVDYVTWGYEFFAAEEVRTALWKGTSSVQGYLVDEWLCIDRGA